MNDHVPAALRRFVYQRAEGVCEYCLIHEADGHLDHQIEHVISQ